MLPMPQVHASHVYALFLIFPIARSVANFQDVCETRMSEYCPEPWKVDQINTKQTGIVHKQETETGFNCTSSDPLSSLLQALRIQDDSFSPAGNHHTNHGENHRNLRELIDEMQRILSTVPRGLLPGRLRKCLSPKLLILDLNGLLLERLKVHC